jgi:hypothetical protein
MQVEKFGLEALEALCGGTDAVAQVLPKYEVNPPGKAEGLWLRLPSAAHEVRHRNMHEADATVLEWSPHGDDDRYPALPFLFSAYDLAAFGLAGSGVFLADRLYDGPDIDEAALRQLGRGKEYLRELVRQAHALEQDAYQQQRIEDGRGEDEQPRDADEAARWLRAERERLLAAERIPAASMAALPAPAAQAVPRFAAQERAVLGYLAGLGVSPTALPRRDAGKPGIKAAAKTALQGTPLFVGSEIFRKTWERLRASKEIRDRS